jgi:hypothetical protein
MNYFPVLHRAVSLSAMIILSVMQITTAPVYAGKDDMLIGNKIAVMPCQLGKATPNTPAVKKNIIDCTLMELCYLEGNPLSNAAEIVTDLLQEELQKRFGDRVLPLDRVRKKYQSLSRDQDATLRSIALQLGTELGVDYVFASNLWRFDERQGSPAGIEKPASVAFAVFMINMRDGKVAWQDVFEKTQRSLTENLLDAPLYIAKGVRWLSARELAAYGVETMFDTFLEK